MNVNDYIRTKNDGIKKILDIGSFCGIKQYKIDEEGNYVIDNSIIKSSPNIIDLLEPMDLMYIDIDNGYEGGIIVPRITETQNELNEYIEKFKDGTLILKGVITKEQLDNSTYWIGE